MKFCDKCGGYMMMTKGGYVCSKCGNQMKTEIVDVVKIKAGSIIQLKSWTPRNWNT